MSGTSRSPSVVISPCIKVCVMDDATNLCTGCGRTLEEIARWGVMADEERERIMAVLPERMAQAFPGRR